MIGVLIVDDHAVVRAGLRYLIDAEPDLETVGQAGTVAEALAQSEGLAPDVILLDIVMPDQNGVAGIPSLADAYPDARILVLTMEDNAGFVRAALAAGADGYVLKESVDTEVVRAIREVAGGNRYVQPELAARILVPTGAPGRGGPLSAREREVLTLIARGHTNPQIAERLVISVRTAEAHRASIIKKLDASSRAELVEYAIREGLLDI
ncbi:MAG: response regulator transcription factor [Actinobacteria bacterium]|nr:response regulator transcription factor [Actinomycetota bacterium]MBV8394912.1 response regulator transcription factor [Actinomycetota bacterium]